MILPCNLSDLGLCLPETVISNDDLAAIVDTNDQWIVERTGIHQRRKIPDGGEASTLGLRAATQALEKAGIDPATLTHVVCATCTPDYLSPAVACIIAGKLNTGPVMAFDFGAACAGFIYGLSICHSILAGNPQSRILFICTEALTRRLNWQDRGTVVLFGDAAAACVISPSEASRLCAVHDVLCQSDGSQNKLIIVGGGTACRYQPGEVVDEDFFISMQGRDTYRHAVRLMVNVCDEILQRNNLTIKDIDIFVPHQANMRIIEAVGARLRIDPEKVFTNIANYGNTSSASIPLAIAEAKAQGRVKAGQKMLITAFGAGLTWGAAILEF